MKTILSHIFVVLMLSGCIFSDDTKDSYDYMRNGEKLYAKGDYQHAIQAFEKAINLDSTNSAAYPGLIKSKIKCDSLIEKYFNVALTQNDSQVIGILDSSIQSQDYVYQKVKEIKNICDVYKNRAEQNLLDDEFEQIHFVVNDVQLMYMMIVMIDINMDGKIDEEDNNKTMP